MSLWQAPYRPPPIRSKAVVRPHRAGASGDVAGQASQPISAPDIIPLQRGYWGTYGKQTLACGAGLLMSLFFVWGSHLHSTTAPHPDWEGVIFIVEVHPNPHKYWEHDFGWKKAMEGRNWELTLVVRAPPQPDNAAPTVYMWLAAAIAVVMLLIPLFFVARWRKMERIFGEDMYDSAEGEGDPESKSNSDPDSESEPDAPLTVDDLRSLHPNRGHLLDGTQVGLTALLLVCAAAVQGVVGSLLLIDLPDKSTMPREIWALFALVLQLQALINLWLLGATLLHRVGAPQMAFLVSLGGAVFSLITANPYAIAACATAAVLMWRTHKAFEVMLARVAAPEKQDPLEAYYHNLLQLLVWVMRADGHCDRRELRKINHTCDAMNMSAWERDVVISSSNLDARESLRDAAQRYLEAAEAASIADAGNLLVVVAIAVAGADGVIAQEEAKAVRQLAKLVGVTGDHADQLLLQQQLHLDALDTARAHELLHLDQGATEAQVLEAHGVMAGELEQTSYQFIGTTLAEQVHQRHMMLDRARDLLLKEATA